VVLPAGARKNWLKEETLVPICQLLDSQTQRSLNGLYVIEKLENTS